MGAGVGLRPTHHSLFLEGIPSSVKWFEVISENYMPWKGQEFGRPFQTLERLRHDCPVSLHGVSMNLGSVDDVDKDYLRRLKLLVDAINPLVVSDHLSWTGVGGKNTHDLLPLPYTIESLNNVVQKIDSVQNFLGRRILIENPSSYLEFTASDMGESEFIAEVLKKADCGLLLDVNNVYVSSINHGFDPLSYLKNIPAERIGQIHLAGHSEFENHLIDTHDQPICPEVWDLFKKTILKFGFKSTMVERDGHIPEWHELELEIKKIGEIEDEIKKSL